MKGGKKTKSKLLEGYRQVEYDIGGSSHNEYMAVPEDKCTFLRTGKNFE